MNSISIQYGTAMSATSTVTETIRNGSTWMYQGVDEKGAAFVTIDDAGDKIILITRLSNGEMLMDAL